MHARTIQGQQELAFTATLSPRDPNVDSRDVKRLSGQNAAILERLRQGPATNAELAAMSLKYTSRVSDLRDHGYVIVCGRGTGGLNTYRLVREADHG